MGKRTFVHLNIGRHQKSTHEKRSVHLHTLQKFLLKQARGVQTKSKNKKDESLLKRNGGVRPTSI